MSQRDEFLANGCGPSRTDASFSARPRALEDHRERRPVDRHPFDRIVRCYGWCGGKVSRRLLSMGLVVRRCFPVLAEVVEATVRLDHCPGSRAAFSYWACTSREGVEPQAGGASPGSAIRSLHTAVWPSAAGSRQLGEYVAVVCNQQRSDREFSARPHRRPSKTRARHRRWLSRGGTPRRAPARLWDRAADRASPAALSREP